MKPVPRSLSSSCGTCIVFSPKENCDVTDDEFFSYQFEKMYKVTDGDYCLLCEKE